MRRAALLLVVGALASPAAPGRTVAAEEPAPAADTAIAAETKELERRLGFALTAATNGPFVVRGDHDASELAQIADACARTLEHYRVVMAADPADVLRPVRRGDAPLVEVFQFKREKEYLTYVDKVFARFRDDTVDDRRLALLRRQRGFFVLTPRPTVVQYQGPGELSTVLSQAVHKTSHVLLLSHRRAGAWMPWWFLEGFGAFQEFGVLRESRTYCLEVARPGDYAKAGTPEADEVAKARMESHWKKRARELLAGGKARDLRVLARLPLNELALEDVIQSWSVVDWLARERKLPAFVRAYKDRREFDAACTEALELPADGAEQRWRKAILGAE